MIWRNILKKRSASGTPSVWRPVVVPALAGGYPVKIVYGGGRWLMIAVISGVHYPLVSTDNGETWVLGSFFPLTNNGTPWVEYLPAAGLFVCCSPSAIFTSSDGLVWSWYAPPNADVGNMKKLGIFQGQLLAATANGSSDKSARTSDGLSWSAVSNLSAFAGGSFDPTYPLACSPDLAIYTVSSSTYVATANGTAFNSLNAGTPILANAAYHAGQFLATDNTGAVPTNRIHKSATGLSGSWTTATLPEAIERSASISGTDDAVMVLGGAGVGGLPAKAALSVDGGWTWAMTPTVGTAAIQPRCLKGVGKRFIAGGSSATPPYTNNIIYIYEVP